MPTKEQAIPPIRICILYNPEGSLEALDFQLSVMQYTTSGRHNISTPTINKKILPKIIIQAHAFVKSRFVKFMIPRSGPIRNRAGRGINGVGL